MLKAPEESRFVQGLVARTVHDAVVSIVRRDVVLRMGFAIDRDSKFLQSVPNRTRLGLRGVAHFVEFLGRIPDAFVGPRKTPGRLTPMWSPRALAPWAQWGP